MAADRAREESLGMNRVHLGDEWWADMTEQEMLSFLKRKELGESGSLKVGLQSVRGLNLESGDLLALRELQARIESTPIDRVQLPELPLKASPSSSAKPSSSLPTIASNSTPIIPKPDPLPPLIPDDEPSDHSDTSSNSSIPAAPHPPTPDPTRSEDPSRGVRDISKAIETLPISLQGPLREILGQEEGGEVVNEEGLPVIDIREKVDGKKVEVKDDNESVESGEKKDGEGYWAPEAVERRRRLREKLFADDDEEDEDDDDIEDQRRTPLTKPRPAKASTSKPSKDQNQNENVATTSTTSETSNRGFMLAARNVKPPLSSLSAPEDIATIDLVDSIPDITERTVSGKGKDKGKGKSRADQAEQEEKVEPEALVPGRRKSVTFAPHTKVRTYEKGEAIPIVPGQTTPPAASSSSGSVSIGTKKKPNENLFGGFKKGFLDSGKKKSISPPKFTLSKSDTKIEMVEDVALPSSVSVKKTQVGSRRSSSSTSPVVQQQDPVNAPFRSEIVMDPEFALPDDLQAQLDKLTGGPSAMGEPDTLQPLAPAHEGSTALAQGSKRQSLFAMRNQAISNGLAPAKETPVVQAKPDELEGRIGTGASRFDRAGDPMKFKVVEKSSKPVEKRTPVTDVQEKMPPRVTINRKNPVKGVVERGSKSTSTPPVVEEESIPLPMPESSSGETTTSKQVAQQLEKAASTEPVSDPESSDDSVFGDNPDDDEDEIDSNKSYEYSDTEDVNFDMDRGLLSREAAMAYHQKRSQLGRKALGGWTGVVDESGQTGFYNDDVDEAQIKSEAVSFGEKLLPGANFRKFDVSNEDEDDDDIPSVNLPTIIPGVENLDSMIRIGKLENGNLILQDDDESADEFANEPQGLAPESEEQKLWRANFREKMSRKEKKKEIIARLGRGEVEEMLKEDDEREQQAKASRVVKEYQSLLPEVREEPGPTSRKPMDEVVTERSSMAAVANPVVERKPLKAEGQATVAEEKPKKVSRFKAARMANGSS